MAKMDVSAYLDRGVEYLRKGDCDLAIADFTEAIRLEPNEGILYSNRSDAYIFKGDIALAISDLEMAARIDPKNEKYSEILGAIKLEPDNIRVSMYLAYGVQHFERGDYDRAITCASKVIQLNPNDVSALSVAYGTRGASHKGKNDFDHAIEDLTEAIRLNPNNAPAYANRGITYLNKGDYDHATKDLEMAVQIDPQDKSYRELFEKVKSSSDGSNADDFFKKKFLRIMLIGVVIGGVFFGIFFGLGIGQFLTAAKERIIVQFEAAREFFQESAAEQGIIKGFLFSVLCNVLVTGFFVSLEFIKSPFITISRLIKREFRYGDWSA